jgi:hypothetical protein
MWKGEWIMIDYQGSSFLVAVYILRKSSPPRTCEDHGGDIEVPAVGSGRLGQCR